MVQVSHTVLITAAFFSVKGLFLEQQILNFTRADRCRRKLFLLLRVVTIMYINFNDNGGLGDPYVKHIIYTCLRTQIHIYNVKVIGSVQIICGMLTLC